MDTNPSHIERAHCDGQDRNGKPAQLGQAAIIPRQGQNHEDLPQRVGGFATLHCRRPYRRRLAGKEKMKKEVKSLNDQGTG